MAGVDIRVGVAIADMSTFVAVDPAYGIGDQRAQVEAALAGARSRGEVPAGIGDIELVFRSFGAVDTDGKRAVADAFAADEVVAVLGARDFTYGAVAVSERHGIPVLDVNAVPTTIHRRCAPYLFTLRAAQDVLYRAFVRWAHGRGLLEGKRLGVFSDRFTATSTDVALSELAALGHEVVVHVRSDGAGYGSDDDRSAAEQFQAYGVEVVLPFVSGSSLVELLGNAVELGYHPTVVDLETGEHVTDVTASLMPAAVYDGTWALAMNNVGEAAAGMTLRDRTRQALHDHRVGTSRTVATSGRGSSGELSNLLITADLVGLLLAGLAAAGQNLTAEGVVAGLETIRAHPTASGGEVTFEPGAHWGFRQVRPIQWSAQAGAWLARGGYAPIAAP